MLRYTACVTVYTNAAARTRVLTALAAADVVVYELEELDMDR